MNVLKPEQWGYVTSKRASTGGHCNASGRRSHCQFDKDGPTDIPAIHNRASTCPSRNRDASRSDNKSSPWRCS